MTNVRAGSPFHEGRMSGLRNRLDEINSRLESLAHLPGEVGSTIQHYFETPLEVPPVFPDDADDDCRQMHLRHMKRANVQRSALTFLPPGQRDQITAACQERNEIIRELRRTDAAASQEGMVGGDPSAIDWNAPEIDVELARLCNAIDWGGPGARTYVMAYSQLLDPCTDKVSFAQLAPFVCGALYSGIRAQLRDDQIADLERDLDASFSSTWDPKIRNGLEFLRQGFIWDVQESIKSALCPDCGERRGESRGPDGAGWYCFRCDTNTPNPVSW